MRIHKLHSELFKHRNQALKLGHTQIWYVNGSGGNIQDRA